MGNNEANPADDSTHRHRGCRHQRRARDCDQANTPHIDSERPRFLVAKRHHVHAPMQQGEWNEAYDERRYDRQEIGGIDRRQAA